MKRKLFTYLLHLMNFFQCLHKGGNVSDVLLKFYFINNQYNTKELPCYFPLYTIEKRVFKAYNAL